MVAHLSSDRRRHLQYTGWYLIPVHFTRSKIRRQPGEVWSVNDPLACCFTCKRMPPQIPTVRWVALIESTGWKDVGERIRSQFMIRDTFHHGWVVLLGEVLEMGRSVDRKKSSVFDLQRSEHLWSNLLKHQHLPWHQKKKWYTAQSWGSFANYVKL